MTAQYQIAGTSAAAIAASAESGITSGELAPGELLPPIRDLAAELGVSPGTVAAAYRLLAQRGLTTSDRRRGTRVRPWHREFPEPVSRSRSGDGIGSEGVAVDLASGNPDPGLLPDLRPILARLDYRPGRYGGPAVDERLAGVVREQLRSDGLPPGSFTCTFGALDGIQRVLTTSLRHGDRVAVEDPGWPSLLDGVRRWGLVPVPVALDDEGVLPGSLWDALAGGARAVVLTSRAQNPTGAAVSAGRAEEIAELMGRYPGVVLVEDDHGHTIADPGRPLNAVAAAAGASAPTKTPPGQWAFVRSASKAYAPDLRLAVVAGDPATVARVETSVSTGAGWVSHLVQQLVAELWTDPEVAGTVAWAADRYRERRLALIEALAGAGIPARGNTGLNVWVPLPDPRAADEISLVTRMMGQGWRVGAGSVWRLVSEPAIRVTTAALPPEQAPAVAAAMFEAIRRPSAGGY